MIGLYTRKSFLIRRIVLSLNSLKIKILPSRVNCFPSRIVYENDRVSLAVLSLLTPNIIGAVENGGFSEGPGHPGEAKLEAHAMITLSAYVLFSNDPGLSRKSAPLHPSSLSSLQRLMEHFSMSSVYSPGLYI